MDETRIDAAPTPAHIFAYRAFRSVFLRSPESSPVRPPQTEVQNLNDDKENKRHPAARGSRFATSPIHKKRDAELAAETLHLSLTPKRQCVDPVSPTKSILKKSNVPTPRRASLRDVTVTFKDVRMSASPELATRGSPARVRSQPDLRNTLATLSSVGISAPVLRPSSASRTDSLQVALKEEGLPQITTGFDLDGYIGQTEKEMRRLIKYGQKWKEHAKKQDKENARLKALVEELQNENEKMRHKDRAVSTHDELLDFGDLMDLSTEYVADKTDAKSNTKTVQQEHQSRRASQEKWKVPLDDITTKKQRPKSGIVPEQIKQPHETQLDNSKAKQGLIVQDDPKIRTKKATLEEPSRHLPGRTDPPQQKAKNLPLAGSDSQEGLHRAHTEQASEYAKPAPKHLPEQDRKAAARERLRLKREAKVGTVRTSSASVVQQPSFGLEARGDNEESQVDWMAMA